VSDELFDALLVTVWRRDRVTAAMFQLQLHLSPNASLPSPEVTLGAGTRIN